MKTNKSSTDEFDRKRIAAIRTALREGEVSGISQRTPHEIIKGVLNKKPT
ncbi:MAG: hypothetical protein HWE30_18120 [Methylocystaceae bacterium]|nr:hypothetical protein [Methylocystaceae bacterium]